MKSTIFKGVLVAAVFYIALMVIESALHPQILLPAVLGSIVLAALACVFVWKNEHMVHTGEVVILWTMVLLFVAYGLFHFFGGGFGGGFI